MAYVESKFLTTDDADPRRPIVETNASAHRAAVLRAAVLYPALSRNHPRSSRMSRAVSTLRI
jgi:hypothetical protein